MRKTFIITGIIVAATFALLFIFNKLTSKTDTSVLYTEVKNEEFEIAITEAGELIAEKSVDIKGPEFAQGRDIRSTNIRIQDLIPEGTIVNEGDYVATLDRTELNNNLKDVQELLARLQENLNMRLLDTSIVQNDIRDEIKNQRFIVEEAAMTFRNSKYEPPTTIRQAEIELDKSQRVLEQRERNYTRRLAQNRTDIYNQNYFISRVTRRVNDLEEVLSGFTVTAPASGMVIYKRERRGNKRKVGSSINPMDRVVATLPDLSSMLSKTYVNEIDVSKIKAGQKVNVTIDAFPGKAFNGFVSFVANIGEKLPNTNDKVFEVQIKIEGSDPLFRPSMTTGNKIVIKTFATAVYIPIECVQAGVDSIPFVFTKNGTKQVVLLGESNEKNIIIEKGLEPGTMLYLNNPEKPEKFKLAGEDLIPVLKEREKVKKVEYERYRKKAEVIL
ncbi:MAG: efflux RND transporter periplasmic adaptor subunit [Bacteroidia bacterium]|nr:efflux RND transporter periplasmic adaptor subunit [Bacteroidia bacterium]